MRLPNWRTKPAKLLRTSRSLVKAGRGRIPRGSVVRSCLPCPRSRRCGYPSFNQELFRRLVVFGLLISKPKNCVSRLAALTLSAWRQRRSLRQVSTRATEQHIEAFDGSSPRPCCRQSFGMLCPAVSSASAPGFLRARRCRFKQHPPSLSTRATCS